MDAQARPSITNLQGRFRAASKTCAFAVVALGLIVLTGWALDIPVLKSIHPSFATMKPNTAMLFICLGLGLWLIHHPGSNGTRRWLAIVIVTVAAFTLAEDAFGVVLGIDQLLFRDQSVIGTVAPGRMPPAATFDFLLLGLAVLFVDIPRARLVRLSMVGVAALVGFVSLCGYLYGVRSLYSMASYNSIAVHTALGFITAAAAYVWARPTEGIMLVATSDSAAGALVRRVVPAVVVVPVVLGWLTLAGQRAGLFDTVFGVVILVVGNIGALALVTWRVAESLETSEQERWRAHADLVAREGELNDALRAARLSEARKTAMINSALDAVVSIDHHGAIVEFNSSAERMFGFSQADAVGRTMADLIVPPALRAAHSDGLARYLRTGKGSVIGNVVEITAVRADGGEFPVELAIAAVEGQTPPLFTGYIRDISERRRNLERFQALVKASAQIVWVTAPDGVVHEDSPAWRAFTGQTYDQGKGFGWLDAFHPEDREGAAALWRQARIDKTPLYAEYRLWHVSGEWRWTAVRAVPLLHADGSVREWIGTNTDITEHKYAEAEVGRARDELELRVDERTADLTKALREKEVLLKEIHHRVKNNLAVISSLLYLESKYSKNEAAVAVFEESQRRVRSIALVHETLYGSKNLDKIDFGEYVHVLATEVLAAYRFSSSDIRLEMDVEPVNVGIDTAVPCGLILNELISNALKHAFPNDRSGILRVVVRCDKEGMRSLSVADNGVGLPAGVNKEEGGSLGLRLIRSLARQIRASFDFATTGPGTVARLTFAAGGNDDPTMPVSPAHDERT